MTTVGPGQPSARQVGQVASAGLDPTGAVDEKLLTRLALILPAGARARWLEEWPAESAELPVEEQRQFLREVLAGLLQMAITLRWRRGLRKAP